MVRLSFLTAVPHVPTHIYIHIHLEALLLSDRMESHILATHFSGAFPHRNSRGFCNRKMFNPSIRHFGLVFRLRPILTVGLCSLVPPFLLPSPPPWTSSKLHEIRDFVDATSITNKMLK